MFCGKLGPLYGLWCAAMGSSVFEVEVAGAKIIKIRL